MDRIAELSALIDRHVVGTGICSTAMPHVSLIRADAPSTPTPAVYEASLCIIAQGSKRVSIGEHSVVYDAAHYLLVSVDLPLVGHVLDASPEHPYLCCKIDLDVAMLADLIASEDGGVARTDLPVLGVYPGDPDLIDAACRLVGLLDRPDTIRALAPLIEREILYRLLTGPHGPMLRHVATVGSHLNQVSRAIAAIRRRFDASIRIDDVAAEAGMSSSSLHVHFKAITRMTPLEYQKQLRLQEARRLMLAEGATASTAGFAVGYESPSQFSREYRRLFGAPPRADIERLHAAPAAAMAL
ncbi:transcriptional regulator [Sphingomonas paucimobilis]|jgi:AraC-like DNA-binding protein|uniref:AraC family transcriptional regulator n=2 Tax=Sphingomonas paucimobilis TaxID=13689 RepID=A0A411LER5_SPHPI|nr:MULTISPECIES: AraC family transcriptional regulator [Sphingomonas]MDG5971478.1 AraC family transcriptional regulator [Sphingomonas paucimobilis]NNG56172.1 AraC family transcriptional regulator [Sphingomonas paucimobilis]QBE90837.1 AraC family transcriptional regulator [Sphingomonas paucimobilis]QPS16032.1 AraC family transcriptional regulator [Sphingomonas paucimobilis]QPT07486.1 AraC family transcriptional regulator [Sphingomonas paucimobilis]